MHNPTACDIIIARGDKREACCINVPSTLHLTKMVKYSIILNERRLIITDTKTAITLPSGEKLTLVEPLLSEGQMQKFAQTVNSPEYKNYTANQMKEQILENLGVNNKPVQQNKNLMVEEQKKTNNLVEQLESKLISIQYENMKLNAQIETLNKTIDSNNEKLNELRTANSKLETVNQTLKDNNKHYWLYTTLITIAGVILGIVLGHYF